MTAPAKVRERPILFSPKMVRAILDGRKTETRRVMKPQIRPMDSPDLGPVWIHPNPDGGGLLWPNARPEILARCPYGAPGEVLWVRETFAARWARRLRLEVKDVRVERVQEISEEEVFAEGVQIPVSPDGRVLTKIAGEGSPVPYMPEGMLREAHTGGRPDNFQYHFIRAHFAALWDKINAARGYPWDENPWVWVVRFRNLEATP